MDPVISGIHHVTAISGPAQANADFYAGFLGLRFVKRTVNFDDPGTYHLYYGDALGRPGTIMTFFPWQDAFQGRAGAGMVHATAFSVPPGGVDYWMARFADEARAFEAPTERFGTRVLAFDDPDGLRLELVEDAEAGTLETGGAGWTSPVPPEHALVRFHSVTLGLEQPEKTARLLTDLFGYAAAGEQSGRLRFASTAGAGAHVLDLVRAEPPIRGRMGKGTIHHVAFRVRDDQEQAYWRDRIAGFGLDVTPVQDRNYFRSIYFREPGGALFEIATDSPGFTADEPPEQLGSALKLPAWYEPRRALIEQRLPALRVPGTLTTESQP